MKKNIKNIQFALFGLMLALSIYSCKDNKWDMYEEKPGYLKEGSLLDLLDSKPEFSEFMSLVKKTGYDSVLRRTDLFTVLAVKNGAFSSIDTSVNNPELKMIMGMLILPSAIQQVNMKNNRYQTISGKHVDFSISGTAIKVNGLPVSNDNFKALNGLAYTIDGVIQPLKSLREVIASNPDFSIYNTYIDSTYTSYIDPAKNVLLGYDEDNNPVYRAPVVYTTGSVYMDSVRLDDENTLSTILIPNNQVINTALTRLLTERANQNGLIVPEVDASHADTTIGYFFIPKNLPYPGDSAILTNYLFRNITRTKFANLAAGDHTFTKVTGGEFSINPSQTTQPEAFTASNGYYYVLKEANLPDLVYRKVFVLDTYIQNPANPTQFVINPNIVFSMGASATIVTRAAVASHNRAIEFNFNNLGGRMDFTLPLLLRGNYKVFLQYVPISKGGILSASSGTMPMKQNLDVSTIFTRPEGENTIPALDADLGNIQQAANGPVTITLKLSSVGPLDSNGRYLEMCTIKFIPI